MLIDKTINTTYEILINSILNGVPDIDKEEVSNNYLNYLFSRYSDLTISEENEKKYLELIIEREKRMWENRDLIYKLQKLKKDKSYDIISEISEQGFMLAYSRLQGNGNTITKEEAEKKIDILISEVDKVFDYNLEDAKMLVSEGIIDYKFASGNDALMSFRLHDMESYQK